MESIRQLWALLHDLKPLLEWGGYPVLMGIIFAETGLLVGFFLPGDSLLVTAGLLVNANAVNPLGLPPFVNLLVMAVTLSVTAVVGDATGFWIGLRAGPKIFTREQSFFFRKDHLLATHAFYEKHGGKTIIIARFMPFFRTFAPVVAGVGQMSYRRFALFNVAGGVGWVFSMSFLGYFLGKVFDAKQMEKVVYLVIAVSLLPVVIGAIRSRKKADPAATA